MSVTESQGAEEAGPGSGQDAPWEWQAGPESSVRRPTDVLSGFDADPRCWPETIDVDRLGPISTEQWANDYCWTDSFDGSTESTWGLWATTWPLPIGRQALHRAFPPSQKHNAMPFANAMPCLGWEYAAFIHSAHLGPNTVTTFCLVDRKVTAPIGHGAPAVLFSKAESRFVVQGPDPTGPTVSSHVEQARVWWRRFRGQRVGAGRPLGSTARTLEDYRAIYRLYYGEELRPPTRDDFVARSGIPESSLKRNLGAWGYTWGSFGEECRTIIAKSNAGKTIHLPH